MPTPAEPTPTKATPTETTQITTTPITTAAEANVDLNAFDGVVLQKSAPDQISDHILSAIAVGALPEGTRLPPERDLAEALSVSRSSVRVALDRLSDLKVLRRQRGKTGGTFVSAIDPQAPQLREAVAALAPFWQRRESLLDARALLQQQIARTAAARRSDEDLLAIRASLHEYSRAGQASDARAADREFHANLALATHNDHLLRMAQELDAAINLGFRHDPYSRELHAQANGQHIGIADAVEAGDAELAGTLADEHFRATTMAPVGQF